MVDGRTLPSAPRNPPPGRSFHRLRVEARESSSCRRCRALGLAAPLGHERHRRRSAPAPRASWSAVLAPSRLNHNSSVKLVAPEAVGASRSTKRHVVVGAVEVEGGGGWDNLAGRPAACHKREEERGQHRRAASGDAAKTNARTHRARMTGGSHRQHLKRVVHRGRAHAVTWRASRTPGTLRRELNSDPKRSQVESTWTIQR